MPENNCVRIYNALLTFYGPQNWWPAESPFEMIVGAVLTQNTAWQNVEKALIRLKEAGVLNLQSLLQLPAEDLASHIRPAGYYNLKARRLQNLLRMISAEYNNSLQDLLDDELYSSREKLLEVKGVGEETADSILLYAGGKPIFVVDTYTHRVFSRHNLVPEESSYGEIQEYFMDNLPAEAALFNEYHALIVRVAKDYCKKKVPRCEACPLNGID